MRVANGVTGGDNTVALDKMANHQHLDSGKEWAYYDSDSTALDEEEDEEEGEWYDSDDTAFDHEDDVLTSGPQSETPTKFEPEGVWIPSEAITVGGPW